MVIKMQIQVIKFGSDCLFKGERLNLQVLRDKWAREIMAYEEETGIKTYIRSSGAVAIEKKRWGDKRDNSKIPTEELVWLAGQGQYKMMDFWGEVFSGICDVSQVQLTGKEDMDKFVKSVEYDANRNTRTIANYNDRLSFSEIRKDNDVPGAKDAILFQSKGLDVIRYFIVTTVDGFYRNKNDSSTIIRDIHGVTNWHYSRCAKSSDNGTGGMISKLDAAKKVNKEGIDMLLGNVDHGFYSNIERIAANSLFHAKDL